MTKEHNQIEVFYENRIIILTDIQKEYYAAFQNRMQLKNLIDKFLQNDYKQLFIRSQNLNDLFTNFKSLFHYQEAAGGLVLNNRQQILAIKNRGVWQLPKGHVEELEKITEAAKREVTEETGISPLVIIKELPSTFHIFIKNDKKYLKRTFWFKMSYRGFEEPVPQTEEGITEAKWIDKNDIWNYFGNTYENLKKILTYI